MSTVAYYSTTVSVGISRSKRGASGTTIAAGSGLNTRNSEIVLGVATTGSITSGSIGWPLLLSAKNFPKPRRSVALSVFPPCPEPDEIPEPVEGVEGACPEPVEIPEPVEGAKWGFDSSSRGRHAGVLASRSSTDGIEFSVIMIRPSGELD